MARGIPIAGASRLRTGISVMGIPESQIAIGLFASRTVQRIVKAINDGALEVESEAVRLVSAGALMAVDSGAMRASTKAYPAKEIVPLFWEAKIGVFPGATESGWPSYTWFVHEGTSLMAARPYIRMAMHNKRNEINRSISLAALGSR